MRLALFIRLAALAVLPIVLSGCGLLMAAMDPYGYGYGDPYQYPPIDIPPYDPMPSFAPSVAYTVGSATIALTDGDKQAIKLDELVSGSQDFGSTTATWRGPDGWSLSLSSFEFPGEPSYPGDTTIAVQRIRDNEIWIADMIWNPTACRVTLTEASAKRLVGTASCQYLRWADGQVPPAMSPTPPHYIDGEDPFGAEITFEASVKVSQSS